VVPPATRLQSRAVWELLVFVVNALIFVLLGMQLGDLLKAVPEDRLVSLVAIGGAITGIAVVVRLIWVPIATWLPRVMSAELRRREPVPAAKRLFLVGWTSMRGIVSLASALALPFVITGGRPFPFRAEIVLITMVVILATLILQGLTLGPLIRWMNFAPETAHAEEEAHARREAMRDAMERLDDLADEEWAREEDVAQLREEYRRRSRSHSELHGGNEAAVAARRRLRSEAIRAERRALIRLRNEGAISDEVLFELESELDVEALRIGDGAVV
jgi:CPA1 family monovalent cation:H+ antiporter